LVKQLKDLWIMSSQFDPRLEQARQLIENRQIEDARVLLTGIIRTDPQNQDALFLYAHVARSSQEAETVLERILELNPYHDEARMALNKLRRGGVTARPAEGQASPTSSGQGSSWLVVFLALVLLGMVAFAAWALLINQDEEPEVVVQPTLTPSLTFTPSDTPTVGPTIDPTDLPASWTPEPTNTSVPSNTPAPSITPHPTLTPISTFTPTPIQIITLEPGAPGFSRLYVIYNDLAAQVAWLDDVTALGQVRLALEALLQGIDDTPYDPDELDENWVNYIEEFKRLINTQIDLAEAREQLLTIQAACVGQESDETCQNDIEDALALVDRRRANWIEQEESTSRQLFFIGRDATATVAFVEAIESLKTPTTTPIVLNAGG
jgi:hypothetical protein